VVFELIPAHAVSGNTSHGCRVTHMSTLSEQWSELRPGQYVLTPRCILMFELRLSHYCHLSVLLLL